MSHKSYATIWAQLELRTDIGNILHELIGEHSLEVSTLAVGSDELRRSSLNLAVCLKVIFDLQRTYQQSKSVQTGYAYLLQPSKLYAAVLHLLSIKSLVFPCPENIPGVHLIEQSFLAQALVSGLRALLLRNYALSSSQQYHFRAAFKEAWNLKYHLDTLDNFIIRRLCPALLDQLCQGSVELASVACEKIEPRDYASGLYPLESRPGELREPARTAALDIDKENNWLKPFCILFDIVWIAEASLIQLCVNSTKPTNSTRQNRPTREDVVGLIRTRKTVLKEVFSRRTLRLDAIGAILLAPCIRGQCNCLEVLHNVPDLLTLSTVDIGFSEFEFVNNDLKLSQMLDESLSTFARGLRTRQKELWNSNGELSNLSNNFDQWVEEWYSSSAGIRPMNESVRQIRRRAYILSCPKLHPIPFDILRGLIEESDGQLGLHDLDNGSSEFQVKIECSQCDIANPVRSVRLVEPLHKLSANLDESLQRRVSKRLDNQTEATAQDISRHTSSDSHRNQSSASRGSETANSSERYQTKREGHLKDLIGEIANNNAPRAVPFYTFSMDGQTLLLWCLRGQFIVIYDVSSDRPRSFNTEPILHATSGTRLYAIVSSDGAAQGLRVYEGKNGRLVSGPHSVKIPVSCVAFSRNDRYVALGSEAAVLILDIDNENVHNFKLPSPSKSTLDSQKIAFSSDNTSFIVATRYKEKGVVLSYISDCTTNTMGRQKVPYLTIPRGHQNDSGLSSVSMNLDAGFVCITAFTSKRATAIVSLETQRVDYLDHKDLDNQIQCAVQTSSGFRLSLVNVKNQVFAVRRQADGLWQVTKKCEPWPERPFSKGTDRMAIAMPDEDTIHLFGLNKKYWRLMII